jgi:hypothetical protein
MEGISQFAQQHPVIWLAVAAFVILFVLRIVAKLACLATMIIGAVIIIACALLVTGGIA